MGASAKCEVRGDERPHMGSKRRHLDQHSKNAARLGTESASKLSRSPELAGKGPGIQEILLVAQTDDLMGSDSEWSETDKGGAGEPEKQCSQPEPESADGAQQVQLGGGAAESVPSQPVQQKPVSIVVTDETISFMRPGTCVAIKTQKELDEHLTNIMSINASTMPSSIENYVKVRDPVLVRKARRDLISSAALIHFYTNDPPFKDPSHSVDELKKWVEIGRDAAKRLAPFIQGIKKDV